MANIGCKHCKGTGLIYNKESANSTKKINFEKVTCPICKGSGDGVVTIGNTN